MENVKYLVKLNIDKAIENGFHCSACGPAFKATLENTNGYNFYFMLEETKALVIIPHSWIEWMAPAAEIKEEEKKEEENKDEQDESLQ